MQVFSRTSTIAAIVVALGAFGLPGCTKETKDAKRALSDGDSTDYCSMASSDCQEFCYKGIDALGDDKKKKAAAEKWFCDNDVTTGQCLIKTKEMVDKYDDKWKPVADASIQKATNEMCMCQSVKDEIKNDSVAGKAWKDACRGD